MKRKVVATQNVSSMCLVCGTENGAGLGGRFYGLDDGQTLGVFQPRLVHQSYPGRLHGGIISAVLDETMGRAIMLTHPDTWGVTAELTVRFRKPVPLDGELRVVARITRDTRRLFEGAGEILLQDGTVAAEARGKYLRLPLEEIAAGGFDESQWYPDDREAPGHVEL